MPQRRNKTERVNGAAKGGSPAARKRSRRVMQADGLQAELRGAASGAAQGMRRGGVSAAPPKEDKEWVFSGTLDEEEASSDDEGVPSPAADGAPEDSFDDAEDGPGSGSEADVPDDDDDEDDEDEEEDEEEATKGIEDWSADEDSGAEETSKKPEPSPASPDRMGLAETVRMHLDDLSSDDEAPKNTVGQVPRHWYADYNHVGYDISGKKIKRKDKMDGIDRFLASQDDPNYRWTIYDSENDEDIVLSKRDVEIIRRMQTGRFPHPEFEPHPEQLEIYTHDKEIHPLSNDPEPKRRFLPSKWEMQKVMKIVRAIREGRYSRKEPEEKPEVYLLWGDDDEAIEYDGTISGLSTKKRPSHIPAPKPRPPGHALSYNPPEEFLFTEEERKTWLATPAHRRPVDVEPRKFDALRKVPLYQNLLKERFERCLDLYLAPRLRKKKLQVNAEDLLPKLPDPSELRPFPTTAAVEFHGHTGRVRSISPSPNGRWLVSGSDDGTVRLWEVSTGRMCRSWQLGGIVHQVAWCPNPRVHIVAIAVGKCMLLLYPGTAGPDDLRATFAALVGSRTTNPDVRTEVEEEENEGEEEDDEQEQKDNDGAPTASHDRAFRRRNVGPGRSGLLRPRPETLEAAGDADARRRVPFSGDVEMSEDERPPSDGEEQDERKEGTHVPKTKRKFCRWRWRGIGSVAALLGPGGEGIKVEVHHHYPVRRLAWHAKGDYVSTVMPSAPTAAVLIHQISRRRSQNPLGKNRGQIQLVSFHPTKPLFYVANQRTVRVYHLVKETLEQKLNSTTKWISTMEVHPQGEHLLVGSYDHRVVWFDTELSSTPFKTLRYHEKAVRRATYHSTYPLMATASDDGCVHIFHARVFDDFTQNPLIVPVKILRAHEVTEDDFGVLDCAFHPTQPWIFTAGSDRTIVLHQNIP